MLRHCRTAYDYKGNTLTKVVGTNTTSYTWDFENRLSSVTLPGSGGTVSFKYDPFGRRIYKSSSTATSVYAYDDDGNLIEEANAAGTVVARYAQGLNIDEPLAMLSSGTTSYYHVDGLGSITSLSSAAGSIANTYTYDSFGKLTNSTGSLVNPFRYTARESDTETSLYYYRARYYDSAIGRFLGEDPVRFDAGDENFYQYVRNNSVSDSDPTGLQGRKHPSPTPNPKPPAGTTCPAPDCAIYVACRGVQGHEEFAHCTVISKNGPLYTGYDGGASGSTWWSRVVVKSGPALPPGPNTWMRPLPCGGPNPINIGCVQQAVNAINNAHLVYSFPIQNSNDAARTILTTCGIEGVYPIP